MSIDEYFGEWSKVIDLKETDKIMKVLAKSKESVCPKLKDIFASFKHCDYHSLRAVIIGQDPYPQRGKATGIAFANPKGTPEESYSPSLKVLMESVIDFSVPHNPIIFDPSLEKWEEQGALMLNSALSCDMNRTGSHSLLWRPFIASFLKELSFDMTGLVYVLMGSESQSFQSHINGCTNHVISVPHPSYFARTHQPMPHSLWHEINRILIGQNGYGIEWYKEEDYCEQENQKCYSLRV